MDNNLKRLEKELRSVAKRCKSVTYSTALLFIFLMLGILIYSAQLEVTEKDIEKMNDDIENSMYNLRSGIDKMRKENSKGMVDAELELIELMEQGDHVVKSPWASWQVGINTFASESSHAYSGKGNKRIKYGYEGIYKRGDWSQRSTMLLDGRTRQQVLAPDSDDSSTINSFNYGLVPLLSVQEPEVEVQIMASVRPKSIVKEALSINPQISLPEKVVKPSVVLNVNKPIEVTEILFPKVTPVEISVEPPSNPAEPSLASAPDITMNLGTPNIGVNIDQPSLNVTINAPTPGAEKVEITAPSVSKVSPISVKTPSAPTVTLPTVTVNTVSFRIPVLISYGNSDPGVEVVKNANFAKADYRLSTNAGRHTLGNYIADSGDFYSETETNMYVDVSKKRAVTLDPGRPGGNTSPQFSFTNKGNIYLEAVETAGIEVQPDTHPGTMKVTGINEGTITGKKNEQVAMIFTDENSNNGPNIHTLINKKNIVMEGGSSAGFATTSITNNSNRKSWVMISQNEGSIELQGDNSHGMVVIETALPLGSYPTGETSKIENSGTITVRGTGSGGITLLDIIPGGAENSGKIEITGNNSFGLYSQDKGSVNNTSAITNTETGVITISGTATKSMGIRVGNTNATGLKNKGTINLESSTGENMGVYSSTAPFTNNGTINVKGDRNIGMYFTGTTGINKNEGTINISGTNGYGVIIDKGTGAANPVFENKKTIAATGANSVGLYAKDSSVTNETGATISSELSHTVVQNVGTFTNKGDIVTNSGGSAALYTENGTFTHQAGKINANNGGIGIFNSASTGTVSSVIEVGDSTAANTGIGVYSKAGTTRTTFSTPDAELKLGAGTVGLYSEDTSQFETVFNIQNLKASIGDRAAFAYFGKKTGTTPAVTITGTTLNHLTVTKMGDQSTLFYGDSGTTVSISENIDTTTAAKFSNVSNTAQLLVSNAGTANIASGKTVTSNMKTTFSGLAGATVNNEGTIALSGKDEALGVYLDASTMNNKGDMTTAENSSVAIYGEKASTLNNEKNITTSGEKSVGMFANASNATNKAAASNITVEGRGSAGIYGSNNSVISNEGTIVTEETGSAGIYADTSAVTNSGTITNEKGSSAGIYALTAEAKDISNTGIINVGLTGSSESKGVGIYAELKNSGTGVLNVSNAGDINIEMLNSIGVYAKNGTASNTDVIVSNTKNITASKDGAVGIFSENSKVTNAASTGKIELKGKSSVGIYGKSNSDVTNEGKILAKNTAVDSASVGILSEGGKVLNKGEITVDGEASAGIIGKDGADILNDASGKINMNKDSSAGIYTENISPTNKGDISIAGNTSAGMYAKNSGADNYTVTNEGNINLTVPSSPAAATKKSVGMYADVSGTGTTKLLNSETAGVINIGQAESVGMYVKNAAGKSNTDAVAENAGKINVNKEKGVGIFAENSTAKNTATGTITLEESGSAGIYGKDDSVITNDGSITVKKDSSAGMYALNSESINNRDIAVQEGGSAGMFAKLTPAATKNYAATNKGTINLEHATGNTILKSVGIYGEVDSGATKILTLSNEKDINVKINESVGILAKNNAANSADKLAVLNSGKIDAASDSSIGISAEKSTVTNTGEITMSGISSAGIYGKAGSEITNAKVIKISGEKSSGIYLEDSNATNTLGGKITADKKGSAGIYGKYSGATSHKIVNEGEVTLSGTSGESKSAGIYGQLEATSTGSLEIDNKNKVTVGMNESVGIYAKKISGAGGTLTAKNNGTVEVKTDKSVGIFADNAIGTNNNTITVDGKEATGIFGTEKAVVENVPGANITLNSTAEKSSGIFVTKAGTAGTNKGTITLKASPSNGMVATAGASVANEGTISGTAAKIIGMYGIDSGTKAENKKNITLEGNDSTGIFTKDDAKGINETSGVIDVNGLKSVGMFGLASAAGKKIDLENKGTINVNKETSTGIFANNSAGLTDSEIKNTGTINLKDKKTVGIYTPKSTISKVGKINLDENAVSSVAVYLSDGAKADASTGIIDLNEDSQNQVAYYIKQNGELTGANIGKVKGYGVGVYLDNASLAASTPQLDYTTGGNSGNGIIGLLMKGSAADISLYASGIKVGDTKDTNYAIGIYADEQGTSASPKIMNTAITAGANGIGLFAENGSNITYNGTMNIGNGTTAGTGIYIGNHNGANPSTVTLNGTVNLNGKNGVGVIATTDSIINFEPGARIELNGPGIGIFGQYGANIRDNGGAFESNGHPSERQRLTEGKSEIIGSIPSLPTGNVMAHVISGEASIISGVTVNAVANSNSIIGLLADGNKNPAAPPSVIAKGGWNDPVYEAVNMGTLDLSNATESTGIFVDSARGKNSGTLIVGNNSTAMYGVFKPTTATYRGAPAGYINKTEILNESGSTITIGNSSAAMYGIGLDKVENKGDISGGNESVGIYATDKDPLRNQNLNVQNSGNITLGNGSAGIFVRQTSSAHKAVIDNSGSITVGDSVMDASGNVAKTAVGIYADNADRLTTAGDITVGNRGIGIFGSSSVIDVNAGNINYSNNGTLAYLENSTFNYNIAGTALTTSSQPLLFINSSHVVMSNNDIDVSANGVGAYINGSSLFTGWNKIRLNQNSSGIYAEDANVTVSGTDISGTAANAKGIVAINSSVDNNAAISLAGDESLGIYSNNTSGVQKYISNSGNIDISGKKSVGVYLEGSSKQTFMNSGTINVAATTDPDKNNSTVGVYAKAGSEIDITNSGTVNVDRNSVGIYSLSSGAVNTTGTSVMNVADEAIGIYKNTGNVEIGGTVNVAPHTATKPDSEPVGVYAGNGVNVVDRTSSFIVGDKSYGVILSNSTGTENTYENTAGSNVVLGSDTTFVYSDGLARITNNGGVTSASGDRIIAFYAKNGGKVYNNAGIDLSSGLGNLAMYATGVGSSIENGQNGRIYVGGTDKSDPSNVIYGIGMAVKDGGEALNRGYIYVKENLGIGMYGSGVNTRLRNKGNIYLDASSATAASKVENMIGVFVDDGATFVNEGLITTRGSYSGNSNVSGLVGVAVLNGGVLENHGDIIIDADRSYGVLIRGTENNKVIIKNYNNITISGSKSYGVRYSNAIGADGTTALPQTSAEALNTDASNLINGAGGSITAVNGADEYYIAPSTDKAINGVAIVNLPDGTLQIQRNNAVVGSDDIAVINYDVSPNISFSNFGVYVDTLGRTKPINLHGVTTLNPTSDLIIGTEFSETTNAKNVIIGEKVLKPFLDQISAGIFNFKPYSASLTWLATPQVNPVTGQIENVTMAKIPYTSFVRRTDNSWNFADGLEQRYDMNALDSREKVIFNKLNDIGKNEDAILAQAYDEMMGHQYANIQQRVHKTGRMLDKEFGYLKNEWETKSKDSNKIKIFGMRDEYSTDTAGIIDYTANAYGVAYLHEDETVKLGDTTGWYAGAVNSSFKFKDIGGSEENQTMIKAGVFRSTPFDHNNKLNWTVSAEGFATSNQMKRKFLVVDEIFEAESDYYTYGAAVKNEVSRSFRTSERTSIKPYGSLKLEYGRFENIKEEDGQMRLEVKGNDYYSIRPEVGVEFKFRQPFGRRSVFMTTATVAYENELGKVGNVGNKARVGYTAADWFNLEGEKDDRKGNIKADWNLGIENSRAGMTFNLGYDTSGHNLRGGLGLRVIY